MEESVAGGQEIELKLRVDGPGAFQALARTAGATAQHTATQINHFFDTSDLRLDNAKHTIRLRDEAGTFTLSTKGPERQGPDATLTQKSEDEIIVSYEEAKALLAMPQPLLTLLDRRAQPTAAPLLTAIRALIADQPLTYIGGFQNERTRLPIRLTVSGQVVDVMFEMDRTSFAGGHIDYEVEVELKEVDAQAATDAVHAFFQNAQVAWRKGPSKAKRFFNLVAGRPIE
jgi:uncharacterized protein YjbK